MSKRKSTIDFTDLTSDAPKTSKVFCQDLKIEVGMTIKVDGHRTQYEVVSATDMGFGLVGPRGGAKHVVRNIHDGTLYIMSINSMRDDSVAIRSLTILS